MKLETFFNKFDELADAPDAVPRMRRFILDLAVEGKLVAQDAKDEPADELLKRVQAEKARLVKSGEIKKQEQLPPVGEDAIPFSLPAGWAASQLGDVAVCLDYMREPINGTDRDLRIAGKKQAELFPYYGATQQQGWIDDFIFDAELVLLGEDGVPFFDALRSKAYLISGKTWVNNHAHVFRGLLVSNPYLMHWLNVFDYTGRVAGSTRSKLNQAKAVDIPIALPPLAEQKRIVAKVDELMALCDRLEAQQQERETRHAALARASLARFAESPQPSTLNLLFHPSYSIPPADLRKSILTLAVQGKLVPQDPNDEPAEVLLERIKAAREALVVERRVRQSDEVEYSLQDEADDAPPGWVGVHVNDVAIVQGGKRLPNGAVFSESPTPHVYIRVTDMKNGTISETGLRYISPEVQREIGRYIINKEDLYITIAGTIGDVGCVPESLDGHNLTENAAKIVFRGSDRRFFQLALTSEFVQAQFLEKTKQMAQPKLALKRIAGAKFYLPPLAEQRRIVAKVEQLIALVDALETQLAASRATAANLLSALVAELTGTPNDGKVSVPSTTTTGRRGRPRKSP